MRKSIVLLPLLLFLLPPPIVHADVSVNAGVTVGGDGVDGFHLAIAQHYRVKKEAILVCRKRTIPDEHLPVVFFLAKRASVSPKLIVDLRTKGKSWMDIGLHFGLGTDIFYVPVTKVPGPPYGRALGHFKGKNRSGWASIQLKDDDVVNLVNIKFISEHYGYSLDDVIKMGKKGENLLKLHGRAKAGVAAGKNPQSKDPTSPKLYAGKKPKHQAKSFEVHNKKGKGGKGRGRQK